MCYGLVELIIESKIIFTFWGHDILSRVMTLNFIFFEKTKLCDGLYNCLLCAIKVHSFSKSITYP